MKDLHRKGFMFVMSSPSGAGKTTLSRLLLEKDNNLVMSISATTRKKRPNEVDGIDYFFIEKDEFEEMVKKEEFLEHAKVFDNYYGTPKKKVDECLAAGKDVLFDIDWQGTEQLAESCKKDLVSVFILPPSMEELGKRLNNRGEDSKEVITNRMSKASHEISHWCAYDYIVINHDIKDSLEKILSVLQGERLSRIRQGDELNDFVEGLLHAE